MVFVLSGGRCSFTQVALSINPITATACKISGLKDPRTRLQTECFLGPITSVLSALRFNGDPFTCQCEKEDKKASEFQISLIYVSFSNGIMAVKVLKTENLS